MPGKARPIPTVNKAPVPKGYAKVLGRGWDSYQEAYNVKLKPWAAEALDRAKTRAKVNANAEGEGFATTRLGSELVQVRANGAGRGQLYAFHNDDFLVMVRSQSEALGWSISVRYLSAGLWEHGIEAMRARVISFIKEICTVPEGDEDWCVVSRADWCFDFHSPLFTSEMVPAMLENVVAAGTAKKRMDTGADAISSVGRGARVETITIGSKAGLQVQVYDKGREITEVSGKSWMRDVWQKQSGFVAPAGPIRDVWRIELRYGSAWLKERNIRTFDQLKEYLSEIVSEGLTKFRLAQRNGDSNRSRWPLHPLWVVALALDPSASLLPIGRRVTGRRSALVDRGKKQCAGGLRSLAVLKHGHFDFRDVMPLIEEMIEVLMEDTAHHRKVESALERYSTVDEAR